MSETQWIRRSDQVLTSPEAVPPLIYSTLVHRGYTEMDEISDCLAPSLVRLTSPDQLKDLDRALDRLVLARDRQESICLYADYDMDGTPGLALLLQALKDLGYENVDYYQPDRLKEGYGLHPHAVENLAEVGTKLIVTIDVGITAVDAAEVAAKAGVELIITDHHLPGKDLPKAVAVINPNRDDCPSRLGHLCGAGVAFYLAMALRQRLKAEGRLEKDVDPKEWLDCFVIGTVTDMVPLVQENRVLVKHGLLKLAETRRPGLRALMRALGLWGRPLTAQDVAIRLAPKLNALSRLSREFLPIQVFLVDDENEAESLVAKVLEVNAERVRLQKFAEEKALQYVEWEGVGRFIWYWDEEIHQGVMGLVATRLCQKYGVPAFIGARSEDGKIVGSARLPAGCDLSLVEILETCSAHLNQFGGHAPAAGFELEIENAEHFRDALKAYFREANFKIQPQTYFYDEDARLSDFNATFMRWYEQLEPFGTGFELPLYRVRDLTVASFRLLRGGHLKIHFSQAGGVTREAIWFSPPPKATSPEFLNARLQALVEPQWNYFNGRKNIQLFVHDLKQDPASASQSAEPRIGDSKSPEISL